MQGRELPDTTQKIIPNILKLNKTIQDLGVWVNSSVLLHQYKICGDEKPGLHQNFKIGDEMRENIHLIYFVKHRMIKSNNKNDMAIHVNRYMNEKNHFKF